MNCFAAAAILLAGIAFYGVFTSEEGHAPAVFGYSVLTVVSQSMEPTYEAHCLLLVKHTSFADAAVGDVVSFYSQDPALNGSLNTHRVAEIAEQDGGRVLITKGDANPEQDLYPVTEEIFLGTVVGSSWLIGRGVQLLQGKYTFLILIIVPLFVLVVLCVRTLVLTYRAEKRRIEEEAKRICLEELQAKNGELRGKDET